VFRHSKDSTDLESASIITQTICELIQHKLIHVVKKKVLLAELVAILADGIDTVPFRKLAFTMEFLLFTLLHRIDDVRYLKQMFKGEAISKLLSFNELLRRDLIRIIGHASSMTGNLILSNHYLNGLIRQIEESGDDYSYSYDYLPEKLKNILGNKQQKSVQSIQEKVSLNFIKTKEKQYHEPIIISFHPQINSALDQSMIHNALLIKSSGDAEKALLEYYAIHNNQPLLFCIMWHIVVLQRGIHFVLPSKKKKRRDSTMSIYHVTKKNQHLFIIAITKLLDNLKHSRMSLYICHFMDYVIGRDYTGIPDYFVSALFVDFMSRQFMPIEMVLLTLLSRPYEKSVLAKQMLSSLLFNKETMQRIHVFTNLDISTLFDTPDTLLKLRQYSSHPIMKGELEQFSLTEQTTYGGDIPRYYSDYCTRLGQIFVFILERLIDLKWNDIYIKFIEVYGKLLRYHVIPNKTMFSFLYSHYKLLPFEDNSMRLSTAGLMMDLSHSYSNEFKLFASTGEETTYGHQSYFVERLRTLTEGMQNKTNH
jgi:hypothetical protein